MIGYPPLTAGRKWTLCISWNRLVRSIVHDLAVDGYGGAGREHLANSRKASVEFGDQLADRRRIHLQLLDAARVAAQT